MSVEPLVTNMRGVARMIGVSLGTAKQLIYANAIPSFTVGRRRLISLEAVHAYVLARSSLTAPLPGAAAISEAPAEKATCGRTRAKKSA